MRAFLIWKRNDSPQTKSERQQNQGIDRNAVDFPWYEAHSLRGVQIGFPKITWMTAKYSLYNSYLLYKVG
jgi:hypothetical protein